MMYQVEDNTIMFEIDRRKIADITPGDTLKTNVLSIGEYVWTEHDSQFVESNPDAHLFLKVRKDGGNNYKGLGVIVIPAE